VQRIGAQAVDGPQEFARIPARILYQICYALGISQDALFMSPGARRTNYLAAREALAPQNFVTVSLYDEFLETVLALADRASADPSPRAARFRLQALRELLWNWEQLAADKVASETPVVSETPPPRPFSVSRDTHTPDARTSV